MQLFLSDFFLHMLDSGNLEGAIPMEEHSATISWGLLAIHGMKATKKPDVAQWENLLKMADKYNFLHIEAYIALVARDCLLSGEDAWEVLKIAIQLKDSKLVGECISLLSITEPPTKWEFPRVKPLGFRCYVAIIRAYEKSNPYSRDNPKPNWTAIGRQFVLFGEDEEEEEEEEEEKGDSEEEELDEEGEEDADE